MRLFVFKILFSVFTVNECKDIFNEDRMMQGERLEEEDSSDDELYEEAAGAGYQGISAHELKQL